MTLGRRLRRGFARRCLIGSSKIELLPANLLDATRNLAKDKVLREALGHTGTEDYIDYYVKTKQDEWTAYHEQVTPWEVKNYLTLF